MKKTVTIQLRPEAAGDTQQVQEVAREIGAEITPLHPGVDDPTLASFYTVEVDDDEAVKVTDQLQSLEAVDAAYVKPQDAMP